MGDCYWVCDRLRMRVWQRMGFRVRLWVWFRMWNRMRYWVGDRMWHWMGFGVWNRMWLWIRIWLSKMVILTMFTIWMIPECLMIPYHVMV